jgi:molybdate transport system regulatory protein
MATKRRHARSQAPECRGSGPGLRLTGESRPGEDPPDPLPPVELRIPLRVYRGSEIALGPGKIELLLAIQATGSIARAAASLGMSYMRAWSLVRTMNSCFRSPLVTTLRGGRQGGRADLTREGREAVDLYVEMTRATRKATAPAWRSLRRRIRSETP